MDELIEILKEIKKGYKYELNLNELSKYKTGEKEGNFFGIPEVFKPEMKLDTDGVRTRLRVYVNDFIRVDKRNIINIANITEEYLK